jgi:hypothetical protein
VLLSENHLQLSEYIVEIILGATSPLSKTGVQSAKHAKRQFNEKLQHQSQGDKGEYGRQFENVENDSGHYSGTEARWFDGL